VLLGCQPADEVDRVYLAKTELGIADLAELNYENVDHLVFLYQTADQQQMQFSKESVQLAKRAMSEQANLFPRVQLEEAIMTYPTPEIIIHFANGFLSVAQFYLLNKDANVQTPIANHDVKWYLDGAEFYYRLAVDFTKKIDQPFEKKISDKIISTLSCIEKLFKEKTFMKSSLCEAINL
jgi:hypothetical protein